MRVGNVVQLKSGGPPMTVESTIGGSECMCMWFDGQVLRKKSFPTDALKAALPAAETPRGKK